MSYLDVPMLNGVAPSRPVPTRWSILDADRGALAAYRRIRREVFVAEQGLFAGDDLDEIDDDPRTVVLVAIDADGTVLGGVRIAPATRDRDLGWWTGSRLVVTRAARSAGGIGAELVRRACARTLELGVVRFEATVQAANARMFARLGWVEWGRTEIGGAEHRRMRWPIDRIARQASATKSFLAELLDPDGAWGAASEGALGGPGFVGDDGAPVPGTDVIAACDAILPAMIDRDPEWAGWCGVLVNVNDLAAMGAEPVGMLNAIGARDASYARRVMNGIRSASDAWGVPVLGGHTQLGVPSALSVTALGRASEPVAGGTGLAGHAISVTADLHGGWRRGFARSQWDSSSARRGAELRELTRMVGNARPAAAKDVSMAGLVGTTGMLAEASGCGAILDVDRIPAPDTVALGDWLGCFPGFGMITTDRPGDGRMTSSVTTTAECGELTAGTGVGLRWPDGVVTEAIPGAVTGLGRA